MARLDEFYTVTPDPFLGLDEDTEVKSLKTKVMAPGGEMDPFVNIKGAKETVPLADGLLPEFGCSKKITQSFSHSKTPVSVVHPGLLELEQCTSYEHLSLSPALGPVEKEDRVLSPEKKVFDNDGPSMPGAIVRPKKLYGEHVTQNSIVYGTKKMSAEFAAEVASTPSPPPLSKTTGVITNHDVFVDIQDICGAAEQNNCPFTKGGFGTVSSITLRNGMCILRKRIKRRDFSNNEVTIPCVIRHPNIMDIYGVLATPEHVDLLMEYAGMSLMDFMKGEGYPLDDRMIVRFSWQLISGVKALGKYGFRHLDLKPNNVCIYQDKAGSLNLKIIDFGSAKLASEMNDFKGLTPEYMAPELWLLWLEKLGLLLLLLYLFNKWMHFMNKSEKITYEKEDVYSAGLIILYMLTGKHVFRRDGKDIISIYLQICQIDFSKHIPEHCPTVMKDPLEHLLKKDPEERWTAEQFLDAVHRNGNCPELQVNIQKVPCKRKAEKQTLRNDMTDGSVSMDTLEAPYTEGWKPTDLVVTFSQSAKVMDDKPTVVDQAGDQHAGQEADECGMSTGGVTDEGKVHQPTTDDAVADDVARNGSMGDPPDDQQNKRLPCFEELLSDMDSSSSIKSRGSASHPKTWA